VNGSAWQTRAGRAGVHELVVIAMAAMDACLVAPLLTGLVSYVLPVDPLVLGLSLMATTLGVQYLARASLQLIERVWLRSALLALAILLTAAMAIHETLYPELPLLDLTWPAEVVGWLRRANMQSLTIPREGIVFVLVLYVWWRGLALAQRRTSSGDVAYRFRLGVVVLSVMLVLASLIVEAPLHPFVFAYFFAGLIGIALARADEALTRHGGEKSIVGPGWLLGVGLAGLVVVLLASGVAALLTGENLLWIGRPLLVVLRWLLFGLVYVMGLVAEVIVRFVQLIVRDIDLERLRATLSPLRQLRPPEPIPEPSRWSPEQLASFRTVAVLGGALLLAVAVSLSLRWLRRPRGGREAGERESVWEDVDVALAAQRLARRALGWLENQADVARSRLGRYLATLTIRRVYARLVDLATDIGFPRMPHLTPYEYLPTLAEAFPSHRAEIRTITEAYVLVHYGEVPDDPARLAAVSAAWEKVRESARQSASAPASVKAG
jgi:hypothetical protein